MTSSELLRVHSARLLAQYLPSLQYVSDVHAKGYLKDAPVVEIEKHVGQLKQFLADKGLIENDLYLLQFAILLPGLQRGIRPPLAALEPARGGFSTKRMEDAAGQLIRVREALTAGRRLLGPLNADTATACAELIAAIRGSAIPADEWIAAHGNLTSEEAEVLAGSAIALFDSQEKAERELAVEILACLANFRSSGLGQTTVSLLERDLLNPPTLYRDAPEAVAQRLVERIPAAQGGSFQHLLLALAWTRGAVAERAFLHWKTHPQLLADRLHIPLEQFTISAGWTFGLQGARRELIALSCYAIVRQAKEWPSATGVPCRVPTGELCPGCNNALAWLFDFSGLGAHHWTIDRVSAPSRVLFCPACVCFATFYSRYWPDGSSELHPANELGASDGVADRPACQCELLPLPRPAFAAQLLAGSEQSCMGGAPGWLQDAEFPVCPDCRNTMKFLAQFDNGATSLPEEGIFYAFFCDGCRVAAVNYQQT